MQLAEGLRATQNLFPGAKREKTPPEFSFSKLCNAEEFVPSKQTKIKGRGKKSRAAGCRQLGEKKGLLVGPRSFSREKVLLPKPKSSPGLFEKREVCQVLLEGGLQGSPSPLLCPQERKTNPDRFWAPSPQTKHREDSPKYSTNLSISASRLSWITLS